MKKKLFLFAAIAAITAISCNRESIPTQPVLDEDGPVELTVSVPSEAMTKISDVGSEDKIGSLQVFVFRESDGALEATGSSTSSTVKITTVLGTKKIAAVVNAPEISVTTLDELEEKVSDLSDNDVEALVMYGSDTKTVSVSTAVEIEVTRLVAKIQISKITNAFSQAEYKTKTMSIDEIFVVNAAGDALYTMDDYTPTKWYNFRGKESGGDCDGLLCDVLTGKTLENGASLKEEHNYYVYANPTETDSSEDNTDARMTRLVVKITIDGKTAYYPMTISEIRANHVYQISELKITRLGSDNPDTPIQVGEATFNVTVAGWEDGSISQYTI